MPTPMQRTPQLLAYCQSYLPPLGRDGLDGLDKPLLPGFVPCASGCEALARVISQVVAKKSIHPQVSSGKPIVTSA
jgi:hypothetical protein